MTTQLCAPQHALALGAELLHKGSGDLVDVGEQEGQRAEAARERTRAFFGFEGVWRAANKGFALAGGAADAAAHAATGELVTCPGRGNGRASLADGKAVHVQSCRCESTRGLAPPSPFRGSAVAPGTLCSRMARSGYRCTRSPRPQRRLAQRAPAASTLASCPAARPRPRRTPCARSRRHWRILVEGARAACPCRCHQPPRGTSIDERALAGRNWKPVIAWSPQLRACTAGSAPRRSGHASWARTCSVARHGLDLGRERMSKCRVRT